MKSVRLFLLAFVFCSNFVFAQSLPLPKIKPERKGSFAGYFAKVESCSPTLSWQVKDKNYVPKFFDIVLYTALTGGEGALPGEKIFYQEALQQNSIQLPITLNPGQRYVWSVRVRDETGQVSPWATYTKNNFLIATVISNLLFGIKTPKVCATSPTALPVENSSSVVKNVGAITKIDRFHTLTEDELLGYLNQGLSVGVIGLDVYSYKKKDRSKIGNDLKSFVLQNGKPLSLQNLFSGASLKIRVIDPASSQEADLPLLDGKYAVLIAQPAKYKWSSADFYHGTGSQIRIMRDLDLSSGQVHYFGDVFWIMLKNSAADPSHDSGFVPAGFIRFSQFKAKYPRLTQKLFVPQVMPVSTVTP